MTDRERLGVLRWAGWAILGIVSALEHGETPQQALGEVIERLERVQATEGDDGRDAGGGHHSTT